MRPGGRYLSVSPSAKISRVFLPFPYSPLLINLYPGFDSPELSDRKYFHRAHTSNPRKDPRGTIKPFIDHDHITTLTPHNTPPETSFFKFSPRRVFFLGFIRNPRFGSPVAARLYPGKDNDRLFQDQIILYRTDPFDTPCDFNRFIDGLLRINEAAQLNDTLVGFNADLE